MIKALKMKKVLATGLCMMTLFSMGVVVRADTTQLYHEQAVYAFFMG